MLPYVTPWVGALDPGTVNVLGFTGARMRLTVNASGYDLTFEHAEDREDRVRRLMGCLFVSFMPSAGLAETVETLTDYYEYYASASPALPEVVRDHSGTVVEIERTPGFVTTE